MKNLVLFVDSAAALQGMCWLRSNDFRPLQHKVIHVNILQDIIHYLNQRHIGDSNTILVKVFGHSGDPVHKGAEIAAVTGASNALEGKRETVLLQREVVKHVLSMDRPDRQRESKPLEHAHCWSHKSLRSRVQVKMQENWITCRNFSRGGSGGALEGSLIHWRLGTAGMDPESDTILVSGPTVDQELAQNPRRHVRMQQRRRIAAPTATQMHFTPSNEHTLNSPRQGRAGLEMAC